MKHEIDDLKRDISMLNQENDRLLKQLEMNDKQGARSTSTTGAGALDLKEC